MEPNAEQLAEYALFNQTDQVFAWPEPFATRQEAEAAAREFRARFARQGYYLTVSGLRIAPEDIELEIVPTGP